MYIPETRVLIEQKSLGIPLDKPQARHGGKTPYEQAKEYDNYLPYDERARWIITSNFVEIWIYDMNARKPEPLKLQLSDLQTKYPLLEFLVKKNVKKVTDEMRLSIQAGELVGKIHDRFLEQYNDPLAKHTQRSLNILCVRLVFCLYAEDAGLFASKNAFEQYIEQYRAQDLRRALIDLFTVLDTPDDQRADMYLPDDLAAFPYVNGGLFAEENIVIPRITDAIKDTLIESSHFNWAEISPTIFGAVFESTLNPETRRSGGMHYTSIENIHKVIDPLFLDDLKAELEEIKTIQVPATLRKRCDAYQDKLALLTFLDPACGSGNFLTETFLSIRRLENEAIKLRVAAERKQVAGQMTFGMEGVNPVRVSISQFYGIEINDFAVRVAQAALWIAESQMLKETEDIVYDKIDFLPLKTNANIVEMNALQYDWERLISPEKLSYIMGNPPFVGQAMRTKEQAADMQDVFAPSKAGGKLDYVAGWFKKASDYMLGTPVCTAFVSSNSICQGESVNLLWELLFSEGIKIQFAHTTFVWTSEAKDNAAVMCVIVGFSFKDRANKRLYTNGSYKTVDHIWGAPQQAFSQGQRHKKIAGVATPALLAVSCKPENSAKNGGHAFLRSLRFFGGFHRLDGGLNDFQVFLIQRVEHSINPFSALAILILGWVKILIYRYVEHCDHLIKSIQTWVLSVIFIIHNGAWCSVNNKSQLFLCHTTGLPSSLDGPSYIVKIKSSFVLL